METPRIVLSGLGPDLANQTWTSSSALGIGRMSSLEVVLEDRSISRRHAEVALTDDGWVVRDLGSSNGTFLNGDRIGRARRRVRQGDVLRVGEVSLRVGYLREDTSDKVRVGDQTVRVAATADANWDDAIDRLDLPGDVWQARGPAFLRLARAGYRLAYAPDPADALRAVLADAVAFFDAQRGAVFLADGPGGDLRSAGVVPRRPPGPGRTVGRTPAGRAFRGGRSLLFADCREDAELQSAESVAAGTMSSIVCAVLRSPEGPLGVLHLDRGPMQAPFTPADLYLADSLAAALAPGVERRQLLDRQQELFRQTVTALCQAVEMRDRYTANHTHRVTTYALILGESLGLPAAERRALEVAVPLHDIGKIAIDDGILRKPGRLSPAEFDQMKGHVLSGSDIVQMVPGLAWARPVVRNHHERWDGGGYPDGLRGDQIPLLARVVGVADAFDAMTSDRPYRKGMSPATAFAELEAQAGAQFDPSCVAAFLKARPRVEAFLEQEEVAARQTAGMSNTVSKHDLDMQIKGPTPVGVPTADAHPAPGRT